MLHRRLSRLSLRQPHEPEPRGLGRGSSLQATVDLKYSEETRKTKWGCLELILTRVLDFLMGEASYKFKQRLPIRNLFLLINILHAGKLLKKTNWILVLKKEKSKSLESVIFLFIYYKSKASFTK